MELSPGDVVEQGRVPLERTHAVRPTLIEEVLLDTEGVVVSEVSTADPDDVELRLAVDLAPPNVQQAWRQRKNRT